MGAAFKFLIILVFCLGVIFAFLMAVSIKWFMLVGLLIVFVFSMFVGMILGVAPIKVLAMSGCIALISCLFTVLLVCLEAIGLKEDEEGD